MKAAELRAKALAYKSAGRATESVFFEGDEYFVRRLTVGQRSDLLRRAGVGIDGALDKAEVGKFQVLAVQEIVCDVEGAKVFEAADTEALLQCPTGGLVDALWPLAMKQLFPSAETASKNSEAMARGAPSSPSPSA